MTGSTGPAGEVVYHGYRMAQGAGRQLIAIEDGDGQQIGVLRHIPRHSPTGMNWGYAGSGPADLARSLLIDALGEASACPDCRGVGYVMYDPGIEESGPEPYDAEAKPDGWDTLRCGSCDGGYRHLPYQDFKFAFVAGWGEEWRITRTDILNWYRAQVGEPQ